MLVAGCSTVDSDFDARLELEKLAALKELAYGASHEINNPLANIAARAQMLLADEADPERRRKLEAIHRQALRAHEMIADLMLFARPPKLNLAPCDVPGVVRQIVARHEDTAADREIELTCHIAGAPAALCSADETQLAVAVDALVTNAIEAVGCGGRVQVTVRSPSEADTAPVEIIVTDDGPGMSDEVRRHMFDPFFSGREAGRGLGFGLSKCWRIVTEHGGRVVVGESAGQGTEIAILLPRGEPSGTM
jgi:signal transduction histidine kinase